MVTILETIQWVLLVILAIICVIEYVFLTVLMQQIDDLNDRMFRLLAGQEQSHRDERTGAWRRNGLKPALKEVKKEQ